MKRTFSISDILNSKAGPLNQHLLEVAPAAKKKVNKYKNTKTFIDGHNFDSVREAKRYKVLKMLLKAGKIGYLELQVPFELNPGGAFSYRYIADFCYIESDTGTKIVNDSKGCKTKEYLKKRRLMKKVHGITILET